MEIKSAALIGLGAIGSYVAPGIYMALGHENFIIIADKKRKQRLDTDGVCINGKKYMFKTADPEREAEAVDLVILSVKGTALTDAAAQIKGFVGKDTVILPLLNGISSEEMLADIYGRDRVIYGIVRVAASMSAQGAVYEPGSGVISIGDAANIAPYSEKVRAVAWLFERAGICYRVPADMKRDMWLKFCANIAENMTAAVLGNPYGTWNMSEHAKALFRMAYSEAASVAAAYGVEITEEDMEMQLAGLKDEPFYDLPSTRQDIEKKKKTEVDFLLGNLLKAGDEKGVETPVCSWLYHAISLMEEMNAGLFQPQ